MNLRNRIRNILYRPDFFDSHAYEVKGGIRFYSLLLVFFIGIRIFLALPTIVQFYQMVLSEKWQEQQNIITNLYPDGMNLTVRGGIVSTNVEEPYPIATPKEWRISQNDIPENLVVIDTTKPIETDDFTAQNTFFILGKNGFGYHDFSKGEFRIYDFRDRNWEGNRDISKTTYDKFVITASSVLRLILLIGCFLLPFILYTVLFIAYLLYLVFGATIVWLGAKLRGHQISYGQAYVAGLYLLPVPFLYEFLSSYGHGLGGNIPFAFTFILFIVTLINFSKIIPVVPSPTLPEIKKPAVVRGEEETTESHT